MSEQKHNKKEERAKKPLFFENPYDIETFFESMTVASQKDMELQYIDRLVAYIRMDPTAELSTLCFNSLRDLKLINME